MDEKWFSHDFDLLSDKAECMSITCEKAFLYDSLICVCFKLLLQNTYVCTKREKISLVNVTRNSAAC